MGGWVEDSMGGWVTFDMDRDVGVGGEHLLDLLGLGTDFGHGLGMPPHVHVCMERVGGWVGD